MCIHCRVAHILQFHIGCVLRRIIADMLIYVYMRRWALAILACAHIACITTLHIAHMYSHTRIVHRIHKRKSNQQKNQQQLAASSSGSSTQISQYFCFFAFSLVCSPSNRAAGSQSKFAFIWEPSIRSRCLAVFSFGDNVEKGNCKRVCDAVAMGKYMCLYICLAFSWKVKWRLTRLTEISNGEKGEPNWRSIEMSSAKVDAGVGIYFDLSSVGWSSVLLWRPEQRTQRTERRHAVCRAMDVQTAQYGCVLLQLCLSELWHWDYVEISQSVRLPCDTDISRSWMETSRWAFQTSLHISKFENIYLKNENISK